MLLNLTNHPSAQWSVEQRAAAAAYGEVQDLPFPLISPADDEARIDALADAYEKRIAATGAETVLLQGEFVFTYRLTARLKARGVRVLAAISERRATETQTPDGRTVKQSEFRFYGFREY